MKGATYLMNYKKFITASPRELANIICYYASVAGDCIGCKGDCIYNKAVCTNELYSWLMGAEDEAFWKGLEQWKKQHNL